MIEKFLTIFSGANLVLKKTSQKMKGDFVDLIEENLLNEKFVRQKEFNALKRNLENLEKKLSHLESLLNKNTEDSS